MSEDRKVGRPKKSTSEKGVRTSSMLKPVYRQIIDDLCKERECSISDAIELCIHQFAVQNQVIEKYITTEDVLMTFRDALAIDRPRNSLDLYEKAMLDAISNVDAESVKYHLESFKERSDHLLQITLAKVIFKTAHNSIAERKYIFDIFRKIGLASRYFDLDKLIKAIQQQWHVGLELESCISYIKLVIQEYESKDLEN